MHRNKGGKYVRKGKSLQGQNTLENIEEQNPVIQMFMAYRVELDEKHDRYEKIVKISRDITIENKRIIFLLHNPNIDVDVKRESILEEAKARLDEVVVKNFKEIATILENLDQYQYQRAYTSGLQEFIEALLLHQFLSSGTIQSWSQIHPIFEYKHESSELQLLFPYTDFVLGIADFTGELMRRCINCLGVGKLPECFKICEFVKLIYTGFLGVRYVNNKELGRKMYVLRQSLTKMELVCYNIKIRGSEVPKHMLVSVLESVLHNENEDDEGFY